MWNPILTMPLDDASALADTARALYVAQEIGQ